MKLAHVVTILEDMGHEVLAIKPWSAHPDDHYLYKVLIKIERGITGPEYVGWGFKPEEKSLFWGNYQNEYEIALKQFNER